VSSPAPPDQGGADQAAHEAVRPGGADHLLDADDAVALAGPADRLQQQIGDDTLDGVGIAVIGQIDAGPADQGIGPDAADEGVVVAPAVQQIVAFATVEPVIAAAAAQPIVAAVARSVSLPLSEARKPSKSLIRVSLPSLPTMTPLVRSIATSTLDKR
jgi:hypothetical protein